MALTVKGPKQKPARPLSGDARAEFSDWLREQGMEIDSRKGLIDGGTVNRAWIERDGQRKQVGWGQCWLTQERPYARCGDYRISSDSPTAVWRSDNAGSTKLTPEQRAEHERHRLALRAEQEVAWNASAQRAEEIWDSLEECFDHPYLEKKGVSSHGLRVSGDRLVMPLINADGQMRSLQFIDGEGGKRFLKGAQAAGNFFVIGDLSGPVINYAEGFATAASYHADHNEPVVVAHSASNLKKVAESLYPLQPDAKHIFIADFDESETGEREAIKAAQVIQKAGGQSVVLMPAEVGDYNDAAQAVEGELLPALQQINVPADFDFERNSNNRIMHTKDNHRGVLLLVGIDVAYNVIKKRMDIDIPGVEFIADLEEDAAITEIEDRCIRRFVPHERLRFNLKLLAREFNPVKQWIESRPWDGQSRLGAFLDTVKSENEDLKVMLMRKWLLGCVAAACRPEGANLEGILVFVGRQAVGKTRWMKTLAPDPEWLLEGATLNPSDKDSVKQCVSHWICELGELGSTFKKADIDQLKAFLTKSNDELRLPYDRAFSRYQRRTAFYGSVNESEFLVDATGNRRFWVIRVEEIDYKHNIDMQQVWAEIKETMLDEGQHWFLNEAERNALQESNEMSRTQSAVEDLILQHVKFGSSLAEPVQMTQLLRDLGIANPRMGDFKEASRVLAEHGCHPRRSNGKKIFDIDYDKPDTGQQF